MRALLERLGAMQEECNASKKRAEEEKASAKLAQQGRAQAEAEAATVRRGLQQTIAELKKANGELKREGATHVTAREELEGTVAELRNAAAEGATDREELKESMVALQQTLQDMHEESAEQSQALMAIRADKEAADAENEALVENVAPLQEQIRELEQSEALLRDAHTALNERLSTAEAAESRLQAELAGSQEATAAVVSELDRLRASVEEIVLQRAMEVGQARVKVIEGAHRKADSSLLGERQHLVMEGTSTPPKGKQQQVEEARSLGKSGSRGRSILAYTMRPGF
eukprot:COSAG04_NODE_6159_length_1395_cov_1.932870_1_plen_287_part_00